MEEFVSFQFLFTFWKMFTYFNNISEHRDFNMQSILQNGHAFDPIPNNCRGIFLNIALSRINIESICNLSSY